MTVKEFALAACSPKEMTVCISDSTYDLINDSTGQLDRILLDVFGEYVVDDFKANEPDKYAVWVKTVPVKEATT